MAYTSNIVYQISTTTGTGNFSLTSLTGYIPFSTAFSTSTSSNRFYYCIRHITANEYEIGEGYLSGGALVRHTVLKSSNSDNLVNFSTGTKEVVNDIPASLQEQLVTLAADLAGKVDENASITGATKTKITYDAKGLVTAGADATTADIADSSNKRYVTDAQLTVIENTSGTNTGDQTNITGNAGTVSTINGLISAGTNVTITGSGTQASPYNISSTGGGSGSPSGSDTYVQFNDGGSFGGDAGLTYNKTTDALTVTGLVHTPIVQAHTSAGLTLEAQDGSDVLVIGSGGGVNATAYGGWNFDGATANTIASFGASKTLSSLSTVTYPTLTELSYVKGVTSAIQTQLNAKATLSFTTISTPAGTSPVADSATDTLTLADGAGISITGNSASDTVTIASTITQYTDEMAQDAVGNILTNTATIDASYSDAGPSISFNFNGTVRDKLVLSGSEQITVDTDMDLSPNDVSQIELMPDADNYLIWGIRAYGDRRFIVLENGHEMFNVILEHESLSSSQRKFYCPNNTNYTIEPRASVIVIEDPEAGAWRVISHSQPTIPSPSNSFETIVVSGQSDVVADSTTDTLTLAAGTGISITTNAGTDTITITNTLSSGSWLTQGQVFARVMNIGVI